MGLLAAGLALAPSASSRPVSAAPDGPGALSHFDLARKDCLGTARNTSSKVWYTVAAGVLSDVYFPTVDTTNVETLQFVVTDGATFTDLQTRDMSYTVRALDPGGMECRVTSTAKSGKYRIVTDYVTDPDRNAVITRTSFEPLLGSGYRLYVRFDPTVNGNGGGGSGERRRRLRRDRHVHRPPDPRRVRPGHDDERGQPGLRPARLRGPGRALHARRRAASPAPRATA